MLAFHSFLYMSLSYARPPQQGSLERASLSSAGKMAYSTEAVSPQHGAQCVGWGGEGMEK